MIGYLEVGLTEDEREVIINHPDLQADANGCGHIIFSPEEARGLADLLRKKADLCVVGENEPDRPMVYSLDQALRVARLWRAHKLLGGRHESAVIFALLAEIERLSEHG